MMLDRYFAGAVSVAANGTAVTGTGTAWVANGVQAGDYLHARGLMVRIAAVGSNTSLTLAEGWPGAALSGSSYGILYRVDADRYGSAMLQLLTTLNSGNLSSLAGLAGTAERVPYFSGTNAFAETPLTAWGRSLLDDNDAAGFWTTVGATSGAAQAYRRGNILGALSQAGGVPTGALLDQGSNANGTYLRLADGTQICVLETTGTDAIATASGSLFTTAGDLTWTYPVTFTSVLFAGGTLVRNDRDGGISLRGRSNSAIIYRPWTTVSLPAGAVTIRQLLAIGRWY